MASDLEIVTACGEAMGIQLAVAGETTLHKARGGYWPLENDTQAMALLKQFKPHLAFNSYGNWWTVTRYDAIGQKVSADTAEDLNRAICECVYNMRANDGRE